MRKRMQEIAAGKFEYEGPKIVFSHERLELQVKEMENYHSSFQIQSINQVPMRGIVFSNNPRMEIINPQFDGLSATINFEFHTEGLLEGDIQKGEFYVILNKNEYSLSFVVSVAREYITSSVGEVKSLNEFAKLAKESVEQAYDLFCQEDFFHLLRNESDRVVLYARALAYPNAPVSNMEEFMVKTGIKEGATYTASCPHTEFFHVTEDIREVIELERSTWGFSEIHITTDVPYIRFQKDAFFNGDFVGNSLSIPFFISAHNLHAGLNYGKITVDCGFYKKEFNLTIENGVHLAKAEKNHEEIKKTRFEITKAYIAYRTGKKNLGTWSMETLQLLDHYLGLVPEDVFAWLGKAQVLLQISRNQEAQWILEKYKPLKQEKYSLENAYYLYLTTFLNKEKVYVRKVALKIEEIYLRAEKKELPFWTLLFVSEAYENSNSRKYNAVKALCKNGNASPVFYVEAYGIVSEHPYVLDEIGAFEARLFYWALRQGIIKERLMQRVAELLLETRQYVPFMYEVLKEAYEKWPSDTILMAICANGIKGEQYTQEYEDWYRMAIEKEMRLTNLYEAYIISANNHGTKEYPKMVQYYFQYKTNLAYKHKAIIYAGIIKNKGEQTTLYLKCKPDMDQFALEQITAGHLDENLAVIYVDYLKQITMTHELARSLAPLLYIHKLQVNSERVYRVIVLHKQTNKEMAYGIVNRVAYFPIYSKDYVVAFEDRMGKRFVNQPDYDLEVLIPSFGLTKKCLKLSPEQMPYLIRYFDELPASATLSSMDLSYLNILLSSQAISERYKRQMRPMLIRHYHESESVELLDEYLKQLDFVGLDHNLRLQATELLIQRGFYRKAYEMMVAYGCVQIGGAAMLTMCSKIIEDKQHEADDFLLGICSNVFFRGKYDETLLNYLAKYYYGSTLQMYEIWSAAKEFMVETIALEERLLAQMLYTESFLADSEAVLASYVNNGGKKLLLDAYVSYFSYGYAVKQAVLPPLVAEQLIGMYKKQMKLLWIEKIALLKYLADNYEKAHEGMAKNLYEELCLKGYVFKFFDLLPEEVTRSVVRKGRRIVEYRTNPGAIVTIHYLREDYGQENSSDYESCMMDKMGEGIFVKEFTMFYGDSLQYYITEKQDGEEVVMTSGQIYETQVHTKPSESRYDMLNGLILAEHLGEKEDFHNKLKQYDRLLSECKEHLKIYEQ